MLVLSRKINEEIVIDGSIRVQVLQVKGKTIRLGISAPADVKILRGELQPFGAETGESTGSGSELALADRQRVLLAQAS
jgi:carbon storage regulator CsrA